MFSQDQYLTGWLWYLAGIALCMAVFWVMTRKIPWRPVRHTLRIVVGAIFLVPWYADETQSFLAPAWVASILEGAFEGSDAFWRAGTPLLVGVFSALFLSILIFTALAILNKRRSSPEM